MPNHCQIAAKCGPALRGVLLLWCAAVAPAPLAADEFPDALVKFEAYAKNPVFSGSGPGHWDAKIRERGWIDRDGDVWRLWYTGFEGPNPRALHLGYATSQDGLTWTRAASNPVYSTGWVEDMQVRKYGDTWLMFAEGLRDRAQWLSSRDGILWRREGALDVRTADGRPIADGPYGTPAVWFENGLWYLFYERGDLGIWLARSTDLARWTNVTDQPVIVPGPDAYDRVYVALNQIVRHEGRYYAFYHGSGSAEKPRLWTTNVAVSTDLKNWKKYPGNPLLPERENKSSGILVFDGRRYRLYTMHDKVDVHFSLGR